MSDEQRKIKEILNDANRTYRLTGGDSGLTDAEYDYLLEQVDDEIFKNQIGVEIERNKVELPVTMGSLNKVKSQSEIDAWCKSKKISTNTEVCITPKFDGLSLLVSFENGQYKSAATRGDGVTGQDVTEHFRQTKLGKLTLPKNFTGYLVGETIMREDTFKEKYAQKFKNPRNMVAGLLSRKQLAQELTDLNFIAFSVRGMEFEKKSAELTFCNENINKHFGYTLEVILKKIDELSDEWLHQVFTSEKIFQCDGLVVEVNDTTLQMELGKETNSLNPAYARAWKPESDDQRPAKVTGVTWQVSKAGYQKPVVQIEPTNLGGVTISNVTGINARFMQESGIAPGAIVSIIRSGDVIPKIVNVILPVSGDVLPKNCVSCQSDLVWNENEVELLCQNNRCREKKISELTDFFSLLEIDEVGEGIVKQFYEAGYENLHDILKLSPNDMLRIEGFQNKKADKVFSSIHAKLQNVSLPILQHASNLFKGLGSRKLELLAKYDSPENPPTYEEILAIPGFSDISAKSYLDGFHKFWEWAKDLPIKIAAYQAPAEGKLTGKSFVFTGFRSAELEAKIEALGGKIGSGVSKNSFALVIKQRGNGSSKEKKAEELGVKIFDQAELEKFLEE